MVITSIQEDMTHPIPKPPFKMIPIVLKQAGPIQRPADLSYLRSCQARRRKEFPRNVMLVSIKDK